MRILLWLRANLLRKRFEREMRDEMNAHIDRATDALIERGVTPEQARREATAEFGDVAYHLTSGRESRGTLWFDALMDDTRYGIRQLWRAPVFTLVASLSVATGIIVAVSAFTLLNAVLFKPLAVPRAGEIHHVYTSDGGGRTQAFGASSYADYLDFARQGGFKSLAAASWQSVAVAVADAEPKTEYTAFVSPNFFSTLELKLARGREFSGVDQPEIVLTYPYWEREFGADPSVLGKTIRVNSVPVTIVGIAPASFRGVSMGPPLVGWLPAGVLAQVVSDADVLRNRGSRKFEVFGRLSSAKQAASSAASRLNSVAEGLRVIYPNQWIDRKNETRLVSVLTHKEALLPPGAHTELVLGILAATLLVLFMILLACTNVAALLLGRAIGRTREITMRLTLGATRGRLIRQLITESLLLALVGCTVSMLGLVWVLKVVTNRVVFADMFDLRPDWRVMCAALATSVLCALIFGLAPAIHSVKTDLRSSLSGDGSGGRQGRNRMRGALIALQVAASCVLIMLAFTAVRGVRAYAAINPGIALDGLVSMEIDRDIFGDDSVRAASYTREVLRLIDTQPGKLSASTTAMLPLGHSSSGASLSIGTLADESVEINTVGPEFFSTVGLGPVRGRVFDSGDTRTSPPVAVVNRAFLDKYGQNSVGSVVTVSEKSGVRIVGVAPDISYHNPREAQRALIYVLDEQIPWYASSKRFLLRVTPGSETNVAKDLRNRMRASFPDLVAPRVETLREHTVRQTEPHRIAGNVALGIGALELALAAVGLYGLLMFALLARTREIGVRLALGASARQASWSVMGEGLRYAVIGAGIGIVVAIPAAIAAQNALPGARAADPLPFIGALGAVILASVAAAYMPVRRAGRIDPASSLRQD